MSDSKYWLGFSLVPEIGAKRLSLLLSWFGDLAHAWTASEPELIQSGLDKQAITHLLRTRQHLDLRAEIAKVEKVGAWVLTLDDERYPPLLGKLPDAPPVLYVRGTLSSADERAICIVGTRKATAYGRDAAHHFARQLAGNSVTIVSGLAHGIDTTAHKGALEGGGRTIAVLGCGIDRVYPADNSKLAQQITYQGAVISEFPIGTPPEARNFPRRNRILSGLALAVLVIEAPEKSGALITATTAAEQGRDVFAIPGSIFNPMSSGPNHLIQDGAKLVTIVDDILSELNIAHEAVQTRAVTERIAPASEEEVKLLGFLTDDPMHIDDLIRQTGMTVAQVSSIMTILELKGLVRSVGYMQYCLVPDLQ